MIQYKPNFQVNSLAQRAFSEERKYPRLYFAMGCYWGTEAQLAAIPGVLSTRVGLTGGTSPNPTYENKDDHVETVEVLYDPQQTSLDEILERFWTGHNDKAQLLFGEFHSAIFLESKEELGRAGAVKKSWPKTKSILKELETFHLGPLEHQKHYLRQDRVLFESLPGGEKRHLSLIATKLNSVAARRGQRSDLEESLSKLGIDEESKALLFRRATWPEESADSRSERSL